MEKSELINLAIIIQKKIYNENIIFYEYKAYESVAFYETIVNENIPFGKFSAYEDQFYEDFMIPIESYSLPKIIKAIQNKEDLNPFGMINQKKCIISDLNHFYKMLKNARRISISEWFRMFDFMIQKQQKQQLQNAVNYYIDTHTDIENFIMKQYLLQKVNQSEKKLELVKIQTENE